LALRVARDGIVLLKNENNLLPLKKNLRSIAVIGPNADDATNQLGDYTTAHILQPIVTVLAGIRAKVAPATKVTYVRGCEVLGEDRSGFAEATQAARNADIAVVVVGEKQGGFFSEDSEDRATVGERSDVASLDLTGVQEDLIRAVYETGTPTVVVLINGRPLSIRWTAEHVPAIVEAWQPGERGGEAVADVLFGDYNPSGRLPITIPRHVGQLPVYYNYKPSKAYWIGQSGYVDMPATPLYEFGYGLNYTKFEYSNLHIDPQEIRPAANVYVSVDVKNVGERQGEEIVQLYVRDVVATVSTPVKQLRGFQKIALEPAKAKTVDFTLTPADLSLLDQNMNWVVEPGTFEIMVGSSSEDIRLKGIFDVKD
jgi:beta-glucosidase